jgi:hypothetical protein
MLPHNGTMWASSPTRKSRFSIVGADAHIRPFVEIRGESKVASELHNMLEKLHSILDEVKQVSSQKTHPPA